MIRPTLLLIPGLLCDAAAWAAQREDLTHLAECHVPDLGERTSISAMAERVLAAAPRGRFAIAGHSMGGRVALEVVRRAPERVERLALLDTGYRPLPSGDAGEKERAGRYELLALSRTAGMQAMAERWAHGMVHPDRIGTSVFRAFCAMAARSTPSIFEAQIGALLARPDAAPVLRMIDCPVLIACGRQDAWSPLSRHEEMHAVIPRSRLCVIEASGHMTTMEQPRAVSSAMADWLGDRLPSSRAAH